MAADLAPRARPPACTHERNETISREGPLSLKPPPPDVYIYIYVCMFFPYLHTHIGGWGGESAAAPTGKSFRFVRACERAGARAARDQLRLPRAICRMNVFFFFFSARVAFSLFDPKNAPNASGLMLFALFYFFHIKTNDFVFFCVFYCFAQGFSLKMQLFDQTTNKTTCFIRFFGHA